MGQPKSVDAFRIEADILFERTRQGKALFHELTAGRSEPFRKPVVAQSANDGFSDLAGLIGIHQQAGLVLLQ